MEKFTQDPLKGSEHAKKRFRITTSRQGIFRGGFEGFIGAVVLEFKRTV